MTSGIPAEFLPNKEQGSDDNGFGGLFREKEDEEKNSRPIESVVVANHSFKLLLPPDVGTLFAHQVWSGSILLAEFLASNAEKYVQNKKTVELGAGTALPSLVALAFGSQLSVITDYPDEEVLQSLKETVGYNWETCGRPIGRVEVVGHGWGEPVDEITQTVSKLSSDRNNGYFDLAILSECLWMHRSHGALVKSVDRLLHPERGCAILTYAHHVPGCEQADDAFFELCEERGLSTIRQEAREMSYMWDSSKTIVVHLRIISRSPQPKENNNC